MLGSKSILTPMIHGLLRISCSRNPKTPQIRSFFYEKWLLFGVLRVNKSCFFMQAWNAWPFDPCIIIIYKKRIKFNFIAGRVCGFSAKNGLTNQCFNVKVKNRAKREMQWRGIVTYPLFSERCRAVRGIRSNEMNSPLSGCPKFQCCVICKQK